MMMTTLFPSKRQTAENSFKTGRAMVYKYIVLVLALLMAGLFAVSCSSIGTFVPFEDRGGIIRDYEALEPAQYIDWFYMDSDKIPDSNTASVFIPDFAFIGDSDYELYDSELRRLDLKKIVTDQFANELKESDIFHSVIRQAGAYPESSGFVIIGAIICLQGCNTQYFVDAPVKVKPRFSLEIELNSLPGRITAVSAKHTVLIKDNKPESILKGLRSAAHNIIREMGRYIE